MTLALTWWCSTLKVPWSWTPKLYLGVWVCLITLGVLYVRAWRRHARHTPPTERDRVHRRRFVVGMVVLWLSSDWPMATLGAGYLLSVHMVQYLLYTMVAAPLLLAGTPRWMFEGAARRLRATHLVTTLSSPWVAGIVYNIALVATHAPPVVDVLRTSQVGSFLLDGVWIASGVVAWLPVFSPRVHERIGSILGQCAYLFVAFGIFPTVPAALITFAPLPLYRTYELAPRIGTWSPIDDQQFAGALMKVGSMPILWGIMGFLFVRSAVRQDREDVAAARSASEAVPASAGSAGPTSSAAASVALAGATDTSPDGSRAAGG